MKVLEKSIPHDFFLKDNFKLALHCKSGLIASAPMENLTADVLGEWIYSAQRLQNYVTGSTP
jgi:hypothetical protein